MFINFIRKSPVLFNILRLIKHLPKLIFRKNGYGFHNDKTLQGFIKNIIKMIPITSFVETGTYKGDTTAHMARNNPDLPIFTCELDKLSFWESRWLLKKFKNVFCFNKSSPDFLKDIVSRIGDLPLFFLDAHWNDYNPLKDELKIISNLKKAIIIIDDMNTIKLDEKNKYHILSPVYAQIGYIIVFYNMEEEFEDFKKLSIFDQYKEIK